MALPLLNRWSGPNREDQLASPDLHIFLIKILLCNKEAYDTDRISHKKNYIELNFFLYSSKLDEQIRCSKPLCHRVLCDFSQGIEYESLLL